VYVPPVTGNETELLASAHTTILLLPFPEVQLMEMLVVLFPTVITLLELTVGAWAKVFPAVKKIKRIGNVRDSSFFIVLFYYRMKCIKLWLEWQKIFAIL